MQERYIPPLLDQANFQLRVGMFRGLNGIDGWRFYDLHNPFAVASSLKSFANGQKSSGEFYERLGNYLKPEHNLRPEDFDLTTYFRSNVRLGRSLSPDDPSRLFFFDTFHGLVLSVHCGWSRLAWCLGLDITIPYRKYPTPMLNVFSVVPVEVMIEQIQGQTYERPGFHLSGFRWEKLLVELTCRWAKSQGVPRILLLPAELNGHWLPNDGIPDEDQVRLKMHYNVTAERCGFRKEETSAPFYCLKLEEFPLNLNKQAEK